MTTKKTRRHYSSEGFRLPFQGWRTSRRGDIAGEIVSEEAETRVEPRAGAAVPRPRRATKPARKAAAGKAAKDWAAANAYLAAQLHQARAQLKTNPAAARRVCEKALRRPNDELNLASHGGRTYREEFQDALEKARERGSPEPADKGRQHKRKRGAQQR
ncbi:hypothetical protein FZ103_05960 [Streptomonospora sp. PA3]|uniref:hypothetical protein n=1 Tax=Streptomonospora sp. PA3 TaxID=2607326 RepID=UPI0012DF225D|nr:hypothetical protein [Streptomonospora sp. PA3]MUL40730.1 hypothetical protein [Streptomonospora sp. PA3]